jgi:hypothetical protein
MNAEHPENKAAFGEPMVFLPDTNRGKWWALVDDLRTLPPSQIVAGIPHIGAL